MPANQDFLAGLILDVAPGLDPALVTAIAAWQAVHSVVAVGSVLDLDAANLIDALKSGTVPQKITALRTGLKTIAER